MHCPGHFYSLILQIHRNEADLIPRGAGNPCVAEELALLTWITIVLEGYRGIGKGWGIRGAEYGGRDLG